VSGPGERPVIIAMEDVHKYFGTYMSSRGSRWKFDRGRWWS